MLHLRLLVVVPQESHQMAILLVPRFLLLFPGKKKRPIMLSPIPTVLYSYIELQSWTILLSHGTLLHAKVMQTCSILLTALPLSINFASGCGCCAKCYKHVWLKCVSTESGRDIPFWYSINFIVNFNWSQGLIWDCSSATIFAWRSLAAYSTYPFCEHQFYCSHWLLNLNIKLEKQNYSLLVNK